MASITERPRKRLTSKPRPEAVGAHRRQQARQPRPSRRQKRRLSREQRRQSARKAGLSRRQLKRICGQFPKPVHAVFDPLAPAFTRPTYRRFVLLALAAILTVGGRTIANLLRCLGALAPGHSSSYHRVFSHRRWSSWTLARRYIAAVLARFAPRRPRRTGRRRHRRRASRGQGLRQGLPSRPGPLHPLVHRLPLGAQVGRPGRCWSASPSAAGDGRCRCWWPCIGPRRRRPMAPKRRHKTPAELLRQMLRVLIALVPGPDVRLLAPTAITPPTSWPSWPRRIPGG